jgi:ubiquinone/menaquinone biosynthesis C-methylase UbiE
MPVSETRATQAITVPADARHPLLKRLAARFGIESSAFLWQSIAARQYRRKLDQDPGYRAWVDGRRDLHEHWGHQTVTDTFGLMHMSAQIYEICRTLRARIGEPAGRRILDAGASDGLFLQEVGAFRGVGVNFLTACARKILDDGQLGCVADVERLPFADRFFDVVICCETLEHVPNPIAVLNELARVCRGRLFITIPWLPRSRITARPAGWPEVESHIFEFSEADFARIATHARVRVVHRDTIQVFPEPGSAILRRWLGHWMYPNFFPKLQYYELKPEPR